MEASSLSHEVAKAYRLASEVARRAAARCCVWTEAAYA